MIDDLNAGNSGEIAGIGDKNASNVGDVMLSPRRRARAQPHEPGTTGDADAALRLEPHICRACHSRLASEPHPDGGRRYVCTNCGLEAVGHAADVLCCCGMKIRRATKGGKSGYALVDAGIRCIPNPDPRPEFPSLYVASEV